MFGPTAAAAEIEHRVGIGVPGSDGEVDGADPTVGNSRKAQRLASSHDLSGTNVDLSQVGNRRTEPTAMIDGHRQHAGNRTSKGNRSRPGGSHHFPSARFQIDPVMPFVSANRRIPIGHGTGHRRS